MQRVVKFGSTKQGQEELKYPLICEMAVSSTQTKTRLLDDDGMIEQQADDETTAERLTVIQNRRPSDEMHRLMDEAKDHYSCEFGCSFHKKTEEQNSQTQKARRQLLLASSFCFLFMLAELVGGYIAHSLALMSDATHLLSDFAGLMISVFALWLTQRESSISHSFGYHRAEILGALFSVFLIWGLTVWLVFEAIERIMNPETVNGKIMFIIALCGIAVNIIMAFILHQGGVHHHHGLPGGHDHSHDHSHGHSQGHSHSHSDSQDDSDSDDSHGHNKIGGHKHDHHEHDDHNEHHEHHEHHDHHDHDQHHKHNHGNHNGGTKTENNGNDKHKHKHKNINVRSAFIHVIGDLFQSIGVLIAASLIWYDHDTFQLADPICTIVFSIIVMFTTYSLVKDALKILMESVPENVDSAALEKELLALSDVINVHDLHVWNLSVGKVSLSVHLVVSPSTMDVNGNIMPACLDGVLRSAQKICRNNHGIDHCTIQIEWPRSLHKSSSMPCPAYCDESINSKPYASPV